MKEAGRKSLDAQARGRHGRLAAVPAPGGHDLHGWQQVLMRLRQFRITAVVRTGIARLLIAGREGQAVVETSVAQPLEAQIVRNKLPAAQKPVKNPATGPERPILRRPY